MADDVNLLDVAYATTGYTGAALANIINLGALLAAKDNRDKIRQSDLTGALELETLGKVAQEANSDQRQKRLAVHEVRAQLISPFSAFGLIDLPQLLSHRRRQSGTKSPVVPRLHISLSGPHIVTFCCEDDDAMCGLLVESSGEGGYVVCVLPLMTMPN
jgi:cell division protease FtsH